jgi:hypothetical protein
MTEANGSFQVPVPMGGRASLVVSGGGRRTFRERGQTYHQPHWRPFEGRLDGVRPGATGLVVRVRAVAPDGALLVRVESPEGAPVAGAELHAYAGEGYPVSRATSDSDGRVAWTDLPHVRLAIAARHGDAATESRARLADVLPSGQTVTIRLAPLAVVAGTVADSEGEALDRATVQAWVGDEWVAGAWTEPTGRFSLEIDPATHPSVDLTVRATAPSGGFLSTTIPNFRVESTNLPIVLRPER